MTAYSPELRKVRRKAAAKSYAEREKVRAARASMMADHHTAMRDGLDAKYLHSHERAMRELGLDAKYLLTRARSMRGLRRAVEARP